jgi:hypothetical protein
VACACGEEEYLAGRCKRHHDEAWYRSQGQRSVPAAEARWRRVTCAKCKGSGQGHGPALPTNRPGPAANRCPLCNGDGYRVPNGDTLVRVYRPKRALRTANYWAVPSTKSGTAVRYDQFVDNGAFNYLAADLLARAREYKTPPMPWWNDPPEAGTWFPVTPGSFLGGVRWQVEDNPYQRRQRRTVSNVAAWFEDPVKSGEQLEDNGGLMCWTPPAPTSAVHLCECCGVMAPMAWERPVSEIPPSQPWLSLSHIGRGCAKETRVERAFDHKQMRSLRRKGRLKPAERAELLCERCSTCHRFKALCNGWWCDACYKAWRRYGRQQDLDYRVFANDRRLDPARERQREEARAAVVYRKSLSAGKRASNQGLYEVALYTGSRGIEPSVAAGNGSARAASFVISPCLNAHVPEGNAI